MQHNHGVHNKQHIRKSRRIEVIEFGEIPNFSRLTEQAGKLRYMIDILYTFTPKYNVYFRYYIKVYNHALFFYMKIQFTV